jgi:hypothetical protein
VSDELLTKLKGFSRTYIVHSNTNPYASAVAAGMMSARSQEAGPYFRPSDIFIPQVEALAAEEVNANSAPDQITADFKSDWIMNLRSTGLPACDLTYDEGRTPEENTMRFLNAYNRRVPSPGPRTVHESRELLIPAEYQQDYQSLLSLIMTGGDLRPYLSRDVLKKQRADKNDGLLNAWGIQHLHFRPEGTGQLLFCRITDTDVFVIQTLPHNAEHLWVDTQLIQIMHDNWPEQISGGKHDRLRPEDIPAAKRSSLRGSNANFPITVADGTVYLQPGGGTMASGDSAEDRMNCDKIFAELQYLQGVIVQSALQIRAALHIPASRKLVVRMAFDNRVCCFYEATEAIRIALKFPVVASST